MRCIDGQWLLVFTCHPDEQARPGRLQHLVHPRRLAARAVGRRERHARSRTSRSCSPRRSSSAATASWAFVGFLNQEPEGILSFEIVDPIPVELTARNTATVRGGTVNAPSA